MCFSFMPLTETKNCEAGRVANTQALCGVAESLWFPFNINFFPVKHLYIAYEIVCNFFVITSASAISYSIAESAEHIILRIKHLKILLIESFLEQNEATRLYKFGKAIQYHNAIIE